jgi:hypothetical protein
MPVLSDTDSKALLIGIGRDDEMVMGDHALIKALTLTVS